MADTNLTSGDVRGNARAASRRHAQNVAMNDKEIIKCFFELIED
jgi:hypothetical protein